MKYKLLVLDVDGTLLNDKKEITSRTHAALLKAQQMGIHVVLASGRPTNGVQPLAEALELNHYGGFILSYNGGQIINAQTGELMFEKRIDPAMIPYLNRKAKENGFAIFTYHKDYILTDSPENKHVQEEAELNKMRIIGVENFPEAVDFAPCKCILTSDDENNLVGLENHWKKRLDGVLEAFRSEDYFLEVAPHFINKGNTLAVLMEMLNITTEEVVAIGDGVADVSMLQLAGTGVAMGNARDSVKACADFTTLSNNMEGVATAIEKVILATIKPTEVYMVFESGFFGLYAYRNVVDLKAFPSDYFYDLFKHLRAVGVSEFFVGIGKVMPDVFQPRSRQKRVHNGMYEYVAVAVGYE